MHVRLAVVIASAGLSVAGAQEEEQPATRPDAAAESPGALPTRVQQLEQTIEEQGAALEEAREQIQALEERLGEQEQLSATVEERTIAAEQQQRADRSQERAGGVQSALEYIVAAQQSLDAGGEDVDAYLAPAMAQLESAANEAGQWGSAAEAGFLLEAAQLLRQIPERIATRNFQDATMLLFAAQQRAATALTFALTPVPPS